MQIGGCGCGEVVAIAAAVVAVLLAVEGQRSPAVGWQVAAALPADFLRSFGRDNLIRVNTRGAITPRL